MTALDEEMVVLLADDGTPIGVEAKQTVHRADTPLHLAFSCYVFDRSGRFLVTRRSWEKKTFPGVWTNSCCGHPAPGESLTDAVRRRAIHELGLEIDSPRVVLPRFRYSAHMNGVTENEICPVLLAWTGDWPKPDPSEVCDTDWVPWPEFVARAAQETSVSPWARLQVDELVAGGHVERFLGTAIAIPTRPRSDPMTNLFELKTRLLVEGIAIDEGTASLLPGRWKFRTEHLYQHDGGVRPSFAYPQELILDRGPDPSGDTVVNVRLNAASRWRLECDGRTVRLRGPHVDQEADLPPLPGYYDEKLPGGVAASSVVQHLGRDALGVIPNNYCSYFKDGSECRFCEIEPSYREAGTFPKFRKPTDTIVTAVTTAAARTDTTFLILTAGNLQRNDRTADYYCEILAGLGDHGMRRHHTYGSIMPPEDPGRLEKMRDAGLDAVAFNLEFHPRQQFEVLAPGKAAFGRDRMIDALRRSVDVYGRGNVYTNFVYGIQTWRGVGIPIDWEDENRACLEAVDDLLGQDVIPLFTIYHTSGKNHIGEVKLDADATVAFHEELGRRAFAAGIANPAHSGLAFNNGTLANTVYNDAYTEASRQLAAT